MILSATDLALATTVPAVFLFKANPECLGTPRCLYSIYVNIVSKTTPLLTATSLMIMNIERCLAIVHPFFHRNSVTTRRYFRNSTDINERDLKLLDSRPGIEN